MTPDEAVKQKQAFRDKFTLFPWVPRKELVSVVGGNGVSMEVEVRQPTMAQRSRILAETGMVADDPKKRDTGKCFAMIAALCCYFPGTDETVIDEVDIPRILKQPAGGWIDTLGNVGMRLMNVEAPADAKKSDPTEKSSSSA